MIDNSCPGCGSLDVYNSGLTVQCWNTSCIFFTRKQEEIHRRKVEATRNTDIDELKDNPWYKDIPGRPSDLHHYLSVHNTYRIVCRSGSLRAWKREVRSGLRSDSINFALNSPRGEISLETGWSDDITMMYIALQATKGDAMVRVSSDSCMVVHIPVKEDTVLVVMPRTCKATLLRLRGAYKG
tara:strand:+ start:1831 stop:2379 length:549 start_codon:yes stop_codon:yes gene_type:complete